MAAFIRRWRKALCQARLEVKIIRRAGGERAAMLAAGGGFRHGLQQLHFAQHGQDACDPGVMRSSRKDPQVLISHPRAISIPWPTCAATGADFGGQHERLLALAARQFGFSDKQIRNTLTIWRPSSSIPTPSRKAIHQRAFHGAATGPFHAQDFPALRLRLSRYANMVLVPQRWMTATAKRCRALSMPPATAGCTIWTIRPRETR